MLLQVTTNFMASNNINGLSYCSAAQKPEIGFSGLMSRRGLGRFPLEALSRQSFPLRALDPGAWLRTLSSHHTTSCFHHHTSFRLTLHFFCILVLGPLLLRGLLITEDHLSCLRILHSISSAKSHLPFKVTHSQVPGVRMWPSWGLSGSPAQGSCGGISAVGRDKVLQAPGWT